MTYRKFKQAIEVFGLGERATMAQIKTRHRQLVKTPSPRPGKRYRPGGYPQSQLRLRDPDRLLRELPVFFC